MRTFHRFLYRIFLPLLGVALVAVVLRFVMVRKFNQENVRLTDGTPGAYPHRGDNSGSTGFENKETVLADLRASMDTLRVASEASDEQSDIEEGQRLVLRFEQSIDKLDAADSSDWNHRLEAARARLQAYARFVEGADGDDRGG